MKKLWMSIILALLFIIPGIAAASPNVAYVLKNVNIDNDQIMEALSALNATVTKIDDGAIPTTNFTPYKLIIVGNDDIANAELLPVGRVNFIALDGVHATDWGIAADMGFIAANQPPSITITNPVHRIAQGLPSSFTVYTTCCDGYLSLPLYYLTGGKALGIQGVAYQPPLTGDMIVSVLDPGDRLLGKTTAITARVVYFGATESEFWTTNARTLFRNAVKYAIDGGDADGDGILDQNDNCPTVYNPTQQDSDGNGIGNACQDTDSDGHIDIQDNCPVNANPDQLDTDHDTRGNVCDTDDDGDMVPDTLDNCPLTSNHGQEDSDGDGQGDVCDLLPGDFDNDGIDDDSDNCDAVINPGQEDGDQDGIGDVCDQYPNDFDNDGAPDATDNCPQNPNPSQIDTDLDTQGDACDTDDDNDVILDGTDNCPVLANPDQKDNENDGLGDVCDPDDDNDTKPDVSDNCPYVANGNQMDTDGDGIGDACDINLKINEFSADSQKDWNEDASTDYRDAFIELYNPAGSSIDTDGLYVRVYGVSIETHPLQGSIASGAYHIIHQSSGDWLVNGRIEIVGSDSVIYDAVSYGSYNDGNSANNAPDADAASYLDECIARVPNAKDTNGDNVDFVKQACRYGFFNTGDIVPAVITLDAPFDQTLLKVNTVVFNFTVTDNNADLLACDLYHDVGGQFEKKLSKNVVNGTKGEFVVAAIPDGFYAWQIRCSDGSSIAKSETRHFTMNIPELPRITPISDMTINETQTAVISVNATDVDGDTLTYSINNANFTQTSSGVFEWTTDYFSSGNYALLVRVTDGVYNVTEPLMLRVLNVNRNPSQALTIQDITFNEDTTHVQVLYGVFTDPDLETLMHSTAHLSDNKNFTVLFTNGNMTIIPKVNFYGPAALGVRARDPFGAVVDSNNFTITVDPVNDDPALTAPATRSIAQGRKLEIQLSAFDVENDPLTYSVHVPGIMASSVTINQSSGLFAFTPHDGIPGGEYVAEFHVTDGQAVDSRNTTITVIPALEIMDLDIIVNKGTPDERRFNDLTENGTFESAPGATIEATLKLKNNLDEPFYGVNLTTILDGTLHLEDSYFSTTINGGETKTVVQTFTLPTLVTEGLLYGIDLNVIGYEIDLDQHTDSMHVNMNLLKDFQDLIFDEPTGFTPSTIACDRTTDLAVTISNTGLFNQSSVKLSVKNTALGIDANRTFNVDKQSSVTEHFALTIPTSVANKDHDVTLTMEYFFGAFKQTKTERLAVTGCGIISSSPSGNRTTVSDHGMKTFSVTIPDIQGLSVAWLVDGSVQGSGTQFAFDGSTASLGDYTIRADLSYNSAVIDWRAWTLTVLPNTKPSANAGVDRTEFVNNTITLDGSGSRDAEGDDLTYSWTQTNGPIVTFDAGAVKPSFKPSEISTYAFQLVVNDGINASDPDTVTVQVVEPPKLIITDLDVKVSGDSDKNLNNGDKISEEAAPGDKVTFDIEVSNMYPDGSDITIEDVEVTVTIKDIDDDDDLDEETDSEDIDAGDSESFKVSFDLPEDAEEDDYTVTIEIEGEDEQNQKHKVDWTLTLEVDRESHEIRILNAQLAPSTLVCEDRTTVLSLSAINLGEDEEDEVAIVISNPQLGISASERGLELDNQQADSDSRYSNSFAFTIKSDVKPGSYPITVSTYYDETRVSDMETLNLIVKSCESPSKGATKTTVQKTQQPVQVRKPSIFQPAPESSGLVSAETIARPTIARTPVMNEQSYMLLLIITAILIVGLIMYLGAYVAIKRR